MSLILEIEFLTGVCRAAREPGDDAPDWPLQPDRVFSALVSAWGTRGEQAQERAALEWLEAQPSPTIFASGHLPRTTPDVFVPPNDFQTPKNDLDKQRWFRDFLALGKRPPEKGGHQRIWRQALSTFPEFRQRKERQFPVARPDDPVLKLVWPAEPDAGVLNDLNNVAECVGYIGHSASLTRCRFVPGDTCNQKHPPTRARRRVYPGRLHELEEAHRENPERPAIRPGTPVFVEEPSVPEPLAEWLVLEAVEGDVPDIRAAALVCRLLRQALMGGYRKVGRGENIPEIVSGHRPDDAPTRQPHLAIVPMAFVGSPYADGRVFGFALIPPQGETLRGLDGFRAAFEKVAPYHPDRQRRILTLQGSPLHGPVDLAPASGAETRKWSLSPYPYLKKSRLWASVTPIVLERHLKRGDDSEIRELVARACENAGLPRPKPDRIRVSKHSAIEGAPPARPLAGEPPWTRWKAPKSLGSRQLIHAVIDFERELVGPVLLGAGRFTGLGLCRTLER